MRYLADSHAGREGARGNDGALQLIHSYRILPSAILPQLLHELRLKSHKQGEPSCGEPALGTAALSPQVSVFVLLYVLYWYNRTNTDT